MKEPYCSPLIKRLFFLLAAVYLGSCNDSSTIGSDIFDDSILNVETIRQAVTVRAKPVLKDSIEVFPKNICSIIYPEILAQSQDDLFGSIKTEIYLGFVYTGSDIAQEKIQDAFVDSVVLQLAYGPLVAGDTTQEVEIEIRKLSESLQPLETYMSNQVLQTEFLNTYSFVPQPSDSIVRIKVDRSYGDYVLGLGIDIINGDSAFVENNVGIAITPSGDIASTLSFNAIDPLTEIKIYYSRPDTQDVLTLNMNTNRLVGSVYYTSYVHDYTSGSVYQEMGSEVFGDSLIVADALYGLETEITLSDVQLDTNNIINAAFIDLYAMEFIEDLLLAPPSGLMLFTVDNEGNRTKVNAANDFRNSCIIDTRFNGLRTQTELNGINQYLYRLNITKEMQDLVVDPNTSELVFRLTSSFNIVETKRFVGFGSGHSTLRIEVPISFTEF